MKTQVLTLISAEEFASLGDIGPAELIHGKVVRSTALKPKHGRIAMRLAGCFGYEFNRSAGAMSTAAPEVESLEFRL